ncbi:hypothetical protein HY640_05360 [Candidatus Woesearchaeota archaeon]|nr:hypothetical protein [Candidatus Woesearchaeota archaeon]
MNPLVIEMLIPDGYKTLFNVFTDLCSGREPSNTSFLELGSGGRSFVIFLRALGYQSEGVEGQKDLAVGPHIFHGDISELERIFWDRKFDFMGANGVFCYEAQWEFFYRVVDSELAPERYFYDNNFKEVMNKTFDIRIEQMLKAASSRLKLGGSLIVTEPWSIDFCVEVAKKAGFGISVYEQQLAVLQKTIGR